LSVCLGRSEQTRFFFTHFVNAFEEVGSDGAEAVVLDLCAYDAHMFDASAATVVSQARDRHRRDALNNKGSVRRIRLHTTGAKQGQVDQQVAILSVSGGCHWLPPRRSSLNPHSS
jgi:hypothetical protein